MVFASDQSHSYPNRRGGDGEHKIGDTSLLLDEIGNDVLSHFQVRVL
jgi:hypothetical protein